MKKINKLLLTCMLLTTFILPQKAFAYNYMTYDVKSVSDNSYTIKVSAFNGSDVNINEKCYAGQPLKNYLLMCSAKRNGMIVAGDYTWENQEYIIVEGEQTVNLTLTDLSTDKIITCEVYLYGLERPKKVNDDPFDDTIGTPKDDELEFTTTTLTASNIILTDDATYDINLVNRDINSSYSWTSSNSKVATVSKKSGLVKGISNGKAEISCESTDGTILTSKVTVITDDENLPMLTEYDLELSVKDVVDINVDNSIAKSTYKWSSSNKSVAKVTSKSGKVTALKVGTTTIQCTITTKDGKTIVLKANVNVE